jgi:serine/threonine-protein kinase HipA
MNWLFVWIRLPDASLRLLGELGTTEPTVHNGHFRAEFEYARDWTEFGRAFALDPESLPLHTASRRFGADLFYPPLSIFDDCLPDDWGRALLSTMLRNEGRRPTPMEMLLRMRGGGTGALIFSDTRIPPEPATTVASTALRALLRAAEKFEAGTLPLDDEFRRLVEGSSRAGGARPKALAHDTRDEWLIKFPSTQRDAGHDVVALEGTCLALGRLAGLEVPEARLLQLGSRRVLMVKRFDVTAAGGRLHMISLRTLCRERPGVYVHSYSSIASAVRKHSAAPAADLAALFRHMVFNAAIGNVDDHLKNFWMLAQPEGYRLAPAFDLVPDITGRGEHTLSFNTSPACPNRAELLQLAHAWDVVGADTIIEQVVAAAATFPACAQKNGVRGTRSLEWIAKDVLRRIANLAGARLSRR